MVIINQNMLNMSSFVSYYNSSYFYSDLWELYGKVFKCLFAINSLKQVELLRNYSVSCLENTYNILNYLILYSQICNSIFVHL